MPPGAPQGDGQAWPRAVALAAGIYAVLGGLVTLVGWMADVQPLTDWKNDGISMFVNPALCAVLTGTSLLVFDRSAPGWRAAKRVFGCTVLALGGLTLFEHLSGVDLGIDTLLFQRPWGQSASAAPMRMGPPASISFLLLGSALLLATFPGRARSIGAGLAVSVSAIALLSLTGHLYGAQQMYRMPYLTGIAMQTASILFALAIGLVASLRDREPMRTLIAPGAAGVLARQTLPLILVIALSLGWVRVYLQQAGYVDTAFGTAARTVVEMLLLTALLWRAVRMSRAYEQTQRESEAEIRQQAKQLSVFLDTAAIALHRVGPDGTLLWANDAELRTLGYRREEYVGRHIADFHVDPDVIADILARLHRGEKLVEYEARMRCKDGSVKHVLIDSSVLWDEGRFVHTQCFTRDVTDRKRSDAEREEANRRKDEFMAILAHELRNPLGPVRNAAHVLKLKGPDTPDLRRAVEMIEGQVAQMARLIDDLLDVSRLSRGRLELRRGRVALQDVVDAAVDACRDELEAKGHELRTALPPGPIVLDADRERIVQLLCNLIGNAIKYTPAGGRIDVRVAARGRVLHVAVDDNGIGIPVESLAKIFELFERVDHSLERQGGLGIGLTLVRQLAELHGGTVEARSAGLGRGSQFVLELPIVAPPAQAAEIPAPPPAASAPVRILVADDHRDAVESLALLLRLAGHEVHTALDGEEAVALAQSVRPQAALLDIGMPKANGYDVARRIREQPWGKHIVLVALTGWGQEADKRRARDVGFDAHLVKPVDPDAIHRLLATRFGPAWSAPT